jgi:hypothetical protein
LKKDMVYIESTDAIGHFYTLFKQSWRLKHITCLNESEHASVPLTSCKIYCRIYVKMKKNHFLAESPGNTIK